MHEANHWVIRTILSYLYYKHSIGIEFFNIMFDIVS